jgi:hypothetical protein
VLEVPARSSVLYPSIGTKWKAVPVPGSPQEALRAIGRNIFEVLEFDAAESHTVLLRSITNGRSNSVQIECWHDPKGGKCLEGPGDWFWKMVPA